VSRAHCLKQVAFARKFFSTIEPLALPDLFPDLMAAAIERRNLFNWTAEQGIVTSSPRSGLIPLSIAFRGRRFGENFECVLWTFP